MTKLPLVGATEKNLSVIIPVYNARDYIVETLEHLLESLQVADLDAFEVVIIDDGSTDLLKDEIEKFVLSHPQINIRYVSQENQGRLVARLRGLTEVRYPYCLLIDSRVLISPMSLTDALPAIEKWDSTVVSGPCRFPDDSTLLELYWDSVTKIVWSDYHRKPRKIRLTSENFNKLPKGTTCLLAPVEMIRNQTLACIKETALSKDLVNDDTAILRKVVDISDYWIDPKLDAIYQPRASLLKFVSHAYHRGKVFTHGFLASWSNLRLSILIFLILSALSSFVYSAASWPAMTLTALIALVLLLTAYCIRIRLGLRNLLSLYVYTPFFLVSYGSGLLVGLFKTLKKKKS
jgi:glycosyltransferase involved in cell wall biosynthesis